VGLLETAPPSRPVIEPPFGSPVATNPRKRFHGSIEMTRWITRMAHDRKLLAPKQFELQRAATQRVWPEGERLAEDPWRRFAPGKP